MASPRVVIVLASALLFAAGCSGSSGSTSSATAAAKKECTPSPVASSTKNPYGDSKVDPPAADEAILTVTSKSGAKTALTMNELEALGTQTLNISEPFVKGCQTFTAVTLKSVLAAAKVSTTAGSLNTVALNDYAYQGQIADLVGSDALIATRLDGKEIPVDKGGPIRLIFADGTPQSSNLDAWNWSLSTLEEK